MKRLLSLLLLCLVVQTVPAERIRFSVLGDTPYSADERRILVFAIENVHNGLTDRDFLVHVGDIKFWQRNAAPSDLYASPTCTASSPTAAEHVAGILDKSTTPVFLLIGDNEWIDCSHEDFLGVEDGEKSNAPQAWRQWRAVFADFTADRWTDKWIRKKVDWQNRTHSVNDHQYTMPNFAFIRDDVLFIGITLPGISELPDNGHFDDPPHDATLRRLVARDAADWLHANLSRHKDKVYSSVVFAHTGIAEADTRGPYKSIVRDGSDSGDAPGFIQAARDFRKPILYIQGDKHKWSVTRGYLGIDNVTNVVVQSNELTSFTVTPETDDDAFSWTRHPAARNARDDL